METSVPIQKISLRRSLEEVKETTEKIESEESLMAILVSYPEWEVFRKKVQARITYLKSKVDNLEENDMATYGAKCLSINIVAAELQAILDDMELNYEVISKKKKNDSGKKE
jgi:hypothetical protein